MATTPFDRRRFIGRTLALGAGFSLRQACAAETARGAPGLIPRRLFFVQPDYGSVRISPDGTVGRYQPIGSELSGSSLRVDTGAELVPRLVEALRAARPE